MSQKVNSPESPASAIISAEIDKLEGIGLHVGANIADRATPVTTTISNQNSALSAIETRLAQEILDVSGALQQFGSATRSIREELPDGAQFDKMMVGLLSLLGFHLSYSLLKSMEPPLLLGDGSEYLDKLGLRLSDTFRELDLEGRKFLAVALIDKGFDECTQ
ncbi:Uncharacterised protein [Cedecea neteri]|uniref:Uncharacterized protein n=1 Tax=Cedecea neteri TaxID=158822 RepID=A0A291DZ42_9ENTR|nr:hypothetical protein [Cedecea neteri]ATF92848.1 hypothetical protein CO704_12460 [Cedecea neteri]ATF93692.1 hypothetical protein CO704_17030 [Cedecea neteri]SQA96746.1 Uncharacterised protein [Cedecea neteri]SQC93397.1 Uncharacterised protein [Cedecea neteri]